MFFPKQRTIYLDHAATTPIDHRVFLAMKPYMVERYGNPSALYKKGVQAKQAIEIARKQVSDALFTQPDTITFTGSATEANNLALFGIARAHQTQGKHIITTRVEHEAVLGPCRQLEKEGFEVTYLDVDESGKINVENLKKAIRKDTILMSIMYANNEVGTIYPIAEIGKYILQYRKKHNTAYPYLHTDACQAVNYLDMSVERLHVDVLTLNASKVYGPKGVGALFVRRGIEVQPIVFGGGQERGLRSGTEHVAAIVGLGKAIEISEEMKMKEQQRLTMLRAYAWERLQKEFGDAVQLNGPELGNRLPNNLNVSFLGYEGEAIVLYLDAKGIFASTGSACTIENDTNSHVLRAMHLVPERESSAIRLTLGRTSSKKDIDRTIKALRYILQKLK